MMILNSMICKNDMLGLVLFDVELLDYKDFGWRETYEAEVYLIVHLLK